MRTFGKLPKIQITRWATREEVQAQVGKRDFIKLERITARPGEELGFTGLLTVPKEARAGPHSVRVMFDEELIASTQLTVEEEEEESKVGIEELDELVKRDLRVERDEGLRLYPDPHVCTMSGKTLSEFLKAVEPIAGYEYRLPEMDCDDFAHAAMGIGNTPKFSKYGIFDVWMYWQTDSGVLGHAFNCVLLGKKVMAVEPQQAQLFVIPEKWRLYKFEG